MSDKLQRKRRLLIAAEAAHQLASSATNVAYDTDQYIQVMEALAALKADVRAIIAENDMYRAMFDKTLFDFLDAKEGSESNGHGSRPADAEAVAAGAEEEPADSGPEQRNDNQGTEGEPEADRPAKPRRRRSQPRRNKKTSSSDTE